MTMFGQQYQSTKTRALGDISKTAYPETSDDFTKTIYRHENEINYMSSYMRLMQRGIDDANRNAIEQIQDLIRNLIVLLGGGQLMNDMDVGDLKYFLPALSALFGFEGPFPISLVNAAMKFFLGYVVPQAQFTDIIFEMISAWIESLVNLVDDWPVVGPVIEQLADFLNMLLGGLRDLLGPIGDWIFGITNGEGDIKWFSRILEDLGKILNLPGLVGKEGGVNLREWAKQFIENILSPAGILANWNDFYYKLTGTPSSGVVLEDIVNWFKSRMANLTSDGRFDASKLFGMILASLIPGLDGSKITSGTIAQALVEGLGDALNRILRNISRRTESLIANHSLEDSTYYLGSHSEYSTEQKQSGKQSAKITTQGSGTWPFVGFSGNSDGTSTFNYIPVVPGQVYYFEAWVAGKSTNVSGAGSVYLQINNYQNDQGLASSTTWTNGTGSGVVAENSCGVVWQKLSMHYTAPADTYFVQPMMTFGHCALNNIFYADNPVFRNVTESNLLTKFLFGQNGIGTAILAAIIPLLDASKIGSGQFAQSMVSNLVKELSKFNLRGRDYQNLVAGSDFESATIPWNTSTGYFELDTTQKWRGTKCLKITSGPTSNFTIGYGDGAGERSSFEAKPGDEFYVEMWVRRDSTWTVPDASGPRFRLIRPSGVTWGNLPITAAMIPSANVWTKISQTFTFPDEADLTTFMVEFTGPLNTGMGTLWVDNIIVRRVNSAELIPGLDASKIISGKIAQTFLNITSVAANIISGILGAANIPGLDASKITGGQFAQAMVTNLVTDLSNTLAKANLARQFADNILKRGPNLIPDPSFENSANLLNGSYVSADQARIGTKSLRFPATGAQQAYQLFRMDTTHYTIPSEANEVFYLEMWVYTSTPGSTQHRIEVACFDAAGTAFSWQRVYTPANIPANTWTRVYGYVTTPANTAQIAPYLIFYQEATAVWYVDTVVCRRVTDTSAINQKLFGGNSPLTSILANVIPGLDASKITGGSFAQSMIANLISDLLGLRTDTNTANANANTALANFTTALTKFGFSNIADWVNDLFNTKGTASSANSTASTAKTNADTALANFTAAFTKFGSGGIAAWVDDLFNTKGTASTAGTNATNAVNTANAASSTANSANTNANTGLANWQTALNKWGLPAVADWVNDVWGTKGTASSASAAASTAQSTANTANSTATTANSTATTARDNLQTTWNNLFDAFSGTTGSTGKTSAQVQSAGGTVRTTANTANSTAGTAKTNADTALANFQTAFTKFGSGGITAWVDNLFATKGTADTANTTASAANSAASTAGTTANTARDNLQITWNNLWNAFKGTTGATNITAAQVQTAGGEVRTTATDASTKATAADTKATSASGAASTAQTTADTANTGLQSNLNNIFGVFTGKDGAASNATLADQLQALKDTYNKLAEHQKQIDELQAKKGQDAVKGELISMNFGDYPDGALPAILTTTYTGTAGPTVGISKGVAQWINVTNVTRTAKIIHSTPTKTDFQVLKGTMSAPPQFGVNGEDAKFSAIGRVSADGNSYVWARGFQESNLVFKGEIGYTLNGVETIWASNIPLSWNLSMTVYLGVGTNARQYQVYSGSKLVYTHTEVGTSSQLGANNRRFGVIAELKAGGSNPSIAGKLDGFSVYDNETPSVNGSTARMYRNTTGGSFAGGGTATALPNGFWTNPNYESPDIDANTADGTMTVTEAKTYFVSARLDIANALTAPGDMHIILQVFRAGVWQNAQFGQSHNIGAAGTSLFGSWVQYLNAGEKVRIATQRGGIATTSFGGDAAGTLTYFSIAG